MRGYIALQFAANGIHQIDTRGVEIAIFQSDVPVVGQRSTNTSQGLPGKSGIRIVNEARIAQDDGRVSVNTGNTRAAAHKSLKAVIGAEVEQSIKHEAQDIEIAFSWEKTRARLDRKSVV